MKIVFILTEIAIGGAERVVLDLCTELQKKNHSITVVALKTLNHNDIMVQNFQRAGIKLLSLNTDKSHPWRLLNLHKIIYDLQPDVVSAHLFHPNIASRLLLGRKRPFKLLNTIHIMEIRKKQSWRFLLDRITFDLADMHTAVSQACADFQSSKLNIHPEYFKVIRNGIKRPKTPDVSEINLLRKKWGVAECDIVLGCVGRLNYQKGFDLLLNMTGKICDKIGNRRIGLVFIGDGPEMKNLQKLAANAPENMQIVFPGYSADAAHECGAFDIFLMPSRFEGFGLTLLEAASHGLPIVAQDIPPLREVIADYPNAVLTDFKNNPDHTLQCIAEMISKEKLKNISIPSVSQMANEYLYFFEQLSGNQN